MADTLRIKRRALGGAAGAPSSLAVGELAFNEVDGGLYIGRSNGSVIQINTRVLLQTVDPSGISLPVINLAQYGSTYDNFEFVVNVINGTGSADFLYAQVSHDGGATYDTGANTYHYEFAYSDGQGSSTASLSGTAAALLQLSSTVNAQATIPIQGSFRIYRPWQNNITKTFEGVLCGCNAAGFHNRFAFTGAQMGSYAVITHVRIGWGQTGGNYGANSTIKLYGLK